MLSHQYHQTAKLIVAITLLLCCVLCAPYSWSGEADAAALAAADGRHDEVVKILTGVIDNGGLANSDLVVAYTNRGIAYSLLGSFARAKQDLLRATAIDHDYKVALHHLGVLTEVYDRDLEGAVYWYKLAASQDFPDSQASLGNMYRDGRGIERSYQSALYWFRRAAAHEHSPAFTALGRMYWYGVGVIIDPNEAVKWFKQALPGNSAKAAYYLGLASENGRGMAQNLEKALFYYRLAAMAGYSEAQNALGYLFRRGKGVRQSYGEAVKWYQLAAEQDNPKALSRLAWILANCPQARFCDGDKALSLAQRAVALESSPASLDTLAAAYARVGRFEEAIEIMNRVLAIVPNASARYTGYQKRLAGYRSGLPSQF